MRLSLHVFALNHLCCWSPTHSIVSLVHSNDYDYDFDYDYDSYYYFDNDDDYFS